MSIIDYMRVKESDRERESERESQIERERKNLLYFKVTIGLLRTYHQFKRSSTEKKALADMTFPLIYYSALKEWSLETLAEHHSQKW